MKLNSSDPSENTKDQDALIESAVALYNGYLDEVAPVTAATGHGELVNHEVLKGIFRVAVTKVVRENADPDPLLLVACSMTRMLAASAQI